MLARHRVVDLRLLVVVLQLREIHHAILARVLGLFINLEHHLVGLKQHKIRAYHGQCMVAATIHASPSATAPARMPAATLCSCTISFHRSKGASFTTMASATTKTNAPSDAKINAFSK